jgi:hypothetical protein
MRSSVLSLSLAAAAIAPAVDAGCGSAFCTLNTMWEAQGVSTDPGFRLDLRDEYINQNQLRAGRQKATPGEFPRPHDEQRTLNRNVITTLDYAPNADWGISAQLPFVHRDHFHLQNEDDGSQTPETWHFKEIGDLRVLARRRLTSGDQTFGVLGGIKLPTGKTDVTNEDGEAAERMLQPGTGTTDLIAGYYINSMRPIAEIPARFFFQTQVQAPVNESKGFRPGTHFSADVGIAYPASGDWSGLLQVNMVIKGRDHGPAAEPEDSGGSFVWLSPGISYAPSRSVQLYGFVQLPVYQRVNGVQLTADWAASAGISVRF